jgi:Txe/YoeB family toxin of Txe-Axe toxin-antitoxin module
MTTTSLTAQAILDVQDFQAEVQDAVSAQEKNKMQFHVGDLVVQDSKLMLDDNVLSDDSTKKILSHLRVKNNFLELQKKMSEDDWETVAQKLKLVSADQPVYARKMSTENKLVDLHLANRKAPMGGILIPEVFDMIVDNMVGSSADDYAVTDRFFDEEKGQVSMTLLHKNKEIDVFGTEEDMWKTGKRITWSSLEFGVFPFFERLVCTNGNVGRQYGFSTNVSKGKYNFAKINAILEREILHASDAATPMLNEATRHLKKNNVSVRELLQYMSLFDPEEHSKILEKYFDLSYLNKVYRCDIEGMHNIWKSTADTGKNAYDFFNDLTYIASHPKETGVSEQFRRNLQIKASDILFKETLDLELIAPKVTFKK